MMRIYSTNVKSVFITLTGNEHSTSTWYIGVIIGGLALLLVIILAVVWCQRRHKPTGKVHEDILNAAQIPPNYQ